MTTIPIAEKPQKTKVPRRSARQRVETLMYLDLGSENGGFPINISDDGMSFQGIRPLQVGQEIFITFKLDGSKESITTKAKIVWLTETRKAGALQYVDMPEDSRRRITEWIALQREDEHSHEDAATEPSPAKVEESPVAAAPESVPNPTPVLTKPAAAITPLPGPSLPAAVTEQTPTPKVVSKAHPEIKTNLPVQPSTGHSKLQQTGRFPAAPAKKKRPGRSRSLEIGLAAFGAIAIISGIMLWPSREALLQRFHPNGNADRPAAPALIAAGPESEVPVAEIPSDLPMKDPSQISLGTNLQPMLAVPSSVGAASSTRINRPEQTVSATRPANSNHGPVENAPFFSLRAMRPRNATVTTARNRQSTSAPPDSVLENTSELPGAGTASGKMLLLESKAPASPVTTTGSIEIISDPYPSIRMPADSRAHTASLGTSLQIGRLVSKVDPAYPPDALRQRMGGKVKLHVVIGQAGNVESASIVDGPAVLAESALRAVRQWHYEPTMVGSTAVGVEQDVTVMFRVTSSSSPAN